MPNIASIFKEEITRLARKELRSETQQLKKASAQYRSDIAALKRRVAALEQKLTRTEKKVVKQLDLGTTPVEGMQVRFSAKGLRKLRDRLGLSGPELAALLDVSAQTIYNWEAESTRPRDQQIVAIAGLRALGKREAAVRLAALAAPAEK